MLRQLEDRLHPPPDQVNFRQALHWIALGLKPVSEKHEPAFRPLTVYLDDSWCTPLSMSVNETKRHIDNAKKLLFFELSEGNVATTGYLIKYDFRDLPEIRTRNESDHETITYDISAESNIEGSTEAIPSTDWNFQNINWEENSLVKSAEEDGFGIIKYLEVCMRWKDIFRLQLGAAGAGSSVDGENSVYTTPFLELMRAAIVQLKISDSHQLKKEEIVEWFLKQKIDGAAISKNAAENMATFVRLPESRKGGNKSPK